METDKLMYGRSMNGKPVIETKKLMNGKILNGGNLNGRIVEKDYVIYVGILREFNT